MAGQYFDTMIVASKTIKMQELETVSSHLKVIPWYCIAHP